ncbi:hypothetical protein ACQPZ2_29965 [Nocardia pseudovaccinii]|uniref:hypothetical protein n=1 Tax=Nocardia pseudovaccinii TaxID=189540 RepID=UPI003D8D7373
MSSPRALFVLPRTLALLPMLEPFSIDTPFSAFPAIQDDLGLADHLTAVFCYASGSVLAAFP